ncbi:MAG: hypothetical protein VX609_03770 [Verrucomicrobiota bacterium]|nr:hypothetical protein [Verrucomicrobiota bacterium]
MNSELTAEKARQYSKNPLFADKTWRWSPTAWNLSDGICQWIDNLSSAAVSFYRAIDLLYRKSWEGESVLRNEELRVPWVADYYDAGKPSWLIEHGRSAVVRSQIPAVLRPDLIPHADGIALTEWDSVPGGIGLTARLESAYELSKSPDIIELFANALTDAIREFEGTTANMVIAVSEEAETYLPEMEWICVQLKKCGFSIEVCSPQELQVLENSVLFKDERVDLIYRFWELFDYDNVSIMPKLASVVEKGGVVVTPPMKHVQEEKLSLALFHHHRLHPFWKETLDSKELDILQSAIPRSWILDPKEIPPGAYLDGPKVNGRKLTRWTDLSKASKKDKRLVIKASGFHETAWGSRSVVIGDDVSGEEWGEKISEALNHFPSPVFVIQEFMKPRTFMHPVFSEGNEVSNESGRVRLSPYFFTFDKKAKWSGTLATFCPADKKIIHGMKDGSLMPCKSV